MCISIAVGYIWCCPTSGLATFSLLHAHCIILSDIGSCQLYTMFDVTTLWKAPVVNPVNRKARSIPGLNPINVYGRVFFFAWFGFFVAFW